MGMAAIHRVFRGTRTITIAAPGEARSAVNADPARWPAWQSKKTSLMFALWMAARRPSQKGSTSRCAISVL